MRRYSGFSKHQGKGIATKVSLDEDTLAFFEYFPVFMGCVDTPQAEDLFSPMLWEHYRGTVIVRPVLDSSLVYLNNHNEVVGSTWLDHHKQFAAFVDKHRKGEKIYEIGGAHGMLSVFARKISNLEWLIHDINPCPVDEYQGAIKKGKFKSSQEISLTYSTIVHSHTLEHVNDPWDFLLDISKSQNVGDKHIFSIPNMEAMISRGDLNFLNFEHNFFLPISLVRLMLNKIGYEVTAESYFYEHSIFIATIKSKNLSVDSLMPNFDRSLAIKESFNRYFDLVEAKVKAINDKMNSFDGEIYLFGAHIFSQILIGMGLNLEKINFCLDNSIGKNGKRLYGTKFMVVKPSELLRPGRKQLVVGAVATYEKEIRNQILELNSDAEIYL